MPSSTRQPPDPLEDEWLAAGVGDWPGGDDGALGGGADGGVTGCPEVAAVTPGDACRCPDGCNPVAGRELPPALGCVDAAAGPCAGVPALADCPAAAGDLPALIGAWGGRVVITTTPATAAAPAMAAAVAAMA
jgi:hypothetical protein